EEQGAERDVRAYLCNGDEINEWFTGTASGNDLALSSESGGQLEGSLSPDASTGTINLEDGTSFPFKTELASGVAGLYDVTVSDDGQLRGSSEAGGRLEGRISEERNGEGLYPVTGTVTAPDGPSQEVQAVGPEAEPAEERWVVLADGRVKGGKKGVQTKGCSDPTTEP
ncbi:MAG: hypothetical protein LC781_19205, partial [Actinobacteria bacterium]|nr:hypothetical protein [Actinomycetota bacterium]